MPSLIRQPLTAAWEALGGDMMSRSDRRQWASARTLDDLGELMCGWLDGRIRHTPTHMGEPCDETRPIAPVLAACNRAGFITDNSSAAWVAEGAYLDGFAYPGRYARLTRYAHTAGLTEQIYGGGARREVLSWYRDRCHPDVVEALRACRFVHVEDPVPGREHHLWNVLWQFARR